MELTLDQCCPVGHHLKVQLSAFECGRQQRDRPCQLHPRHHFLPGQCMDAPEFPKKNYENSLRLMYKNIYVIFLNNLYCCLAVTILGG
jgi:hypothetical protein